MISSPYTIDLRLYASTLPEIQGGGREKAKTKILNGGRDKAKKNPRRRS